MNDYFTFFYVKHFELPMCMKCAIQINLPCLNTVFRFIKSIFFCMKKNMLVHLRISSENMVLYMLETVSCIFDVLFDCLTYEFYNI